MIKVLLLGHAYKHDLFELIRVFFPDKEIEFIDKEDRNFEGLFIDSSLIENLDDSLAITKVYNNGELVKKNVIDIDKIHIDKIPRKRLIKNAIKKSIYDSLIDLVDQEIPWGILTGIRPIKIAHDLINSNLSSPDIKSILMNQYRIHEEKAQLMIDIAKSQREHLYPIDEDKYSLYIGIPFCPTRCSYCSFASFAIGENYHRVSKYLDSLIYEIREIKDLMKGKTLNTVYIGGGTPTSLKLKDLEGIIATVRDLFSEEDIKEFTVEAGRPDTLNFETLKMLKSMGVDRVTINPQTMNPKTLKRIGRNHDIKSIIETYNMAKGLGFESINMDIILGLPGEGIGELSHTLNEIEKLDPENLTVHTLAIKRGSKLFNRKDRILREDKDIANMLDLTKSKARQMGMTPYYLYRQKQILGNLENIGYAKPNKECIYNISMMEEKETIIGAGLGAVSKFYYPKENRIKRLANYKDLKVYSSRVDELITKKEILILT